MEITTKSYNRCEVVTMEGRVDTYTAPQLQEVFDGISENGNHNIVFDMTGVDFLSSKGLWVLTETQKKCKKGGGKLALANVNEKILGSFDLVGMADYFTVFGDLTAAVGSF